MDALLNDQVLTVQGISNPTAPVRYGGGQEAQTPIRTLSAISPSYDSGEAVGVVPQRTKSETKLSAAAPEFVPYITSTSPLLKTPSSSAKKEKVKNRKSARPRKQPQSSLPGILSSSGSFQAQPQLQEPSFFQPMSPAPLFPNPILSQLAVQMAVTNQMAGRNPLLPNQSPGLGILAAALHQSSATSGYLTPGSLVGLASGSGVEEGQSSSPGGILGDLGASGGVGQGHKKGEKRGKKGERGEKRGDSVRESEREVSSESRGGESKEVSKENHKNRNKSKETKLVGLEELKIEEKELTIMKDAILKQVQIENLHQNESQDPLI